MLGVLHGILDHKLAEACFPTIYMLDLEVSFHLQAAATYSLNRLCQLHTQHGEGHLYRLLDSLLR